MKKEIIELLEIIENLGFEAYIVGGFVRDFYMDKISNDIDICTNADIEILKNVFDVKKEKYGSMEVNYKGTIFQITIFRKEVYSENRIPTIQYTQLLEEDLLRRDFTINSICMNKNGEYIDILNGIEDINNKSIVMIGNPLKRLREDPLRILRAIRFAVLLDFNIEQNLSIAIEENNYLIQTLSFFRKKEELDKIFSSSNNEKGINFIKKYDLEKYLKININNKIIPTNNYLASWSQIEYDENYPFTKKEKNQIKIIRDLLSSNTINSYHIYKYGLKMCLLAGKIKDIDENRIKLLEQNLPIRRRKEIKIEIDDIKKATSHSISHTYQLVEKAIINKELENNKAKIIEFLKSI